MSQLTIDLNCDMGESFGSYRLGEDEQLLPYISSANIACGFHAGDPGIMLKTVKMALQQGVALGAHPGLPDLAGFGRRQMAVTSDEVYAMVLYQIGALQGIAQAAGGALSHVKPHGALYNMAAANSSLAEAIAEAVYSISPSLVLYGLAGSALIEAGKKRGLNTAREVFADRTYQQDGSLTPRSQPQALITDPAQAASQVIGMLQTGRVKTQQGTNLPIQADTVCIHGDGPYALAIARHLHNSLRQAGITIQPIR